MKASTFLFLPAFLISAAILTGCASNGSGFPGNWVNTRNPMDTFKIVRNGDRYLVVNNDNKVGATFEKGMLETKGILGPTELTYDRQTDMILTPGFFGQTQYKRKK